MDDGEVDLSSQVIFSNPETFEDFLQTITTTCTHTHTCNPPGPSETAHTHTCYHTHTRVFSTDDDSCSGGDKANKPKKPRKAKGNREAVRKYRQKKKAHTEYLEEEVKKLRTINQQLVKKLQGQAALEAEVARLRTLLVDVRGKIDGALGNYPFQTQCNNAGDGLSCDAVAQCFLGKGVIGSGSCGPAVLDCHISPDSEQYPN